MKQMMMCAGLLVLLGALGPGTASGRFQAATPSRSSKVRNQEAEVRERILDLLTYLESIQR